MSNIQLTQELVKSIFYYHEDGFLIWKEKPSSKSNIIIGSNAGWLSENADYLKLKICCNSYSVHRIIFLYHKGYLPEKIDHVDLNKLNNRIGNLRESSSSGNAANRLASKNSTSKYMGVSKRTSRPCAKNQWFACIENNGTEYLGVFDSEQNAALAYNKAAVRIHKEFACLNIIKLPNGNQVLSTGA